MNEFERRWKLGINAARRARPSLPDEAPFGFAARVVAHWQARPEPPLAALWQALALRVLGAMALVLLGLAALGAISSSEDEFFHPSIENAVADSFWLL